MKCYDIAYKEKNRAFYCIYSDTIRSCPENYLLAVRNDTTQRFVALGDGACKKYFKKIQKAIRSTSCTVGSCAIASNVSKILPGSFKNHGFDVWQ